MSIEATLGGGIAATTSTPAPAAAPSIPAPSSTPAPSTPSTPPASTPATPPSTTTPAASTPAPAASAAASMREQLAQHLGQSFNLSQYQDDASAFRAVAEALRNAGSMQRFAEVGQQVMPHLGQFQNWMAEQQKAEEARRAAENKWWSAPEFDPNWRNGVELDANGNMVAKAGFPVDLPQKIAAWQMFGRDKFDQFLKDPIGMLKPGLEQMIKEIAGQVAQQNVGQLSAQTEAQGFLNANSHWMYEHDAQKQPIVGQNGRSVLTQAGQIFQAHYQAMMQQGIKESTQAYEMAKKLTLADLTMQAQQKAPATPAPAAPAAPTPAPAAPHNRLQELSNAKDNGGGIPKKARKPLRAQMLENMTAAGIETIN